MYEAEQSLRNIIDREGLTSTPLGTGPATAEDLDIVGLLSSL